MRIIGGLAAAAGAAVALYALFVFDVSVSSGYGGQRVNNIGLISDRQNLIMVGCAVAVVGALVALFGKSAVVRVPVRGADGEVNWRPLTSDEETGFARAEICIDSDLVDSLRENLERFNIPANAMFPTGEGLLQRAAGADARKCTALLLEKGADPGQIDMSQQSATDRATTEEIKALLAAAVQVSGVQDSPPVIDHGRDHYLADQLKTLADLHSRGALSDEEFSASKRRLLAA